MAIKGKHAVRTIVCFMCLILILNPVAAFAEHRAYSQPEIRQTMERIIAWKKADNKNAKGNLLSKELLANAGTSASDWYALGIGRLGIEDDAPAYLEMVRQNVAKRYQKEGRLDGSKATEWHRIALAVLAAGGDPTQPINLIADGVYYRGRTKPLSDQGINGSIWGLITLDALRYKTPDDAADNRDTIITEILRQQLKDGGFALDGSQSDADMTGMAIQALAPYYNSEQAYTFVAKWNKESTESTVRQAVDRALQRLSALQKQDGDFSSWGMQNVESTSQVLVALCALGIDPLTDQRFIKGGNTVIDGIMKYRRSDGGFIHSFTYDKENRGALPDKSNSMASEQTLYALAAYYRFCNGYRSLYDFRPEPADELKESIAQLNKDIVSLKESGKKGTAEIKSLFKRYLDVPIAERCYVYSYKYLAQMMSEAKISNTSEYLTEAMNIAEQGKGAVTDLFNTGSGSYENYVFTERDYRDYKAIPDNPPTDYYSQIISLLAKISNAQNASDYPGVKDDLEAKKTSVEAVQQKIEDLGTRIMETLYPFEKLGISDKKAVDGIVEEINSLPESDQPKVQGYEDVKRAQTQIDSKLRALIIGGVASAAAAILIAAVVYRIRKRKKELLPDYEDDGDDEE